MGMKSETSAKAGHIGTPTPSSQHRRYAAVISQSSASQHQQVHSRSHGLHITPMQQQHYGCVPSHHRLLPGTRLQAYDTLQRIQHAAAHKLNVAIQARLMIHEDTFAPLIKDILVTICRRPEYADNIISSFNWADGADLLAMDDRRRRKVSQRYLAEAAGMLGFAITEVYAFGKRPAVRWYHAEQMAQGLYDLMYDHDAMARSREDLSALCELLRQDAATNPFDEGEMLDLNGSEPGHLTGEESVQEDTITSESESDHVQALYGEEEWTGENISSGGFSED